MNYGKWMCLFSFLLILGCTAPHYFWPQRDIGFKETNLQTLDKKILIASRDSAFKQELVDRITAAYSNRPVYIRTTGIEALSNVNANDYSAVVLITTCMGWTVDVEVERFLTRYGHLSSIIVLATSNGGDVLPDMENRKIDALSSASLTDRVQPLAQKLIAKINRLIKGPRKNNFPILGARIWISFVRSGGAKTGGIASSLEDFGAPGAGEDGLKPGCIDAEIIFARALSDKGGQYIRNT